MAHKEELARIHKFTLDLQAKVKQETANFSEDVKFWAEYRTGIKSFTPWLETAETETADGLGKPGDLPQALALFDKISLFEKKCLMNFKVITFRGFHTKYNKVKISGFRSSRGGISENDNSPRG